MVSIAKLLISKQLPINIIEIIQNVHMAFVEDNLEAVLANFDSNIVWNECQGFPVILGDGISVVPEAVVQDVLQQIQPQSLLKRDICI